MDAIELLLGLHFLHTVGAGILFEAEQIDAHLLSYMWIKILQVLRGGGSDFETAGQGSVP